MYQGIGSLEEVPSTMVSQPDAIVAPHQNQNKHHIEFKDGGSSVIGYCKANSSTFSSHLLTPK